MNRTSRIALAVLAVLTLALLIPPLGWADGYRNLPVGARAIGAFGGYRVFAEDSTAAIHNTANLVEFDDAEAQVHVLGGYGKNTFEAMGGAISAKTDNRTFVLPAVTAVLPLEPGQSAIGLGAYIPYGRLVDWGTDSFFAQNNIPYYGRMMVADFTANLSLRLTETITVGFGADVYHGEVEQRTLLTGPAAAQLGLPSGARETLTAEGQALGANAAVVWALTENQRLAATVRSPFAIDFDGHNRIDFVGRIPIKGTIDYPTIVALGYGIQVTETLRAEVNVEWLEFSRYRELVIENPYTPPTVVPQELKNTWTAGVGVEWAFAPQWTLRTGFQYLENPTPDRTYSPLGPDENQEVLSLGLGYQADRHSFDVAYAIGLFDGRKVQGSVNSPDGKYDYDLQVLAFSYGYQF